MTSTLTRPPSATPENASSPPAPVTTDPWAITGDHKRLGLLFMAGGLAAIVAGACAALTFQLPNINDNSRIWTGTASRLASANVSLSLVIGIPALWIGLATHVSPLQIGTTRLALPRLHNLALWIYAGGAVLATIGYVADRPPISGLGSSLPALARKGRSAEAGTEILIMGLLLVALATFLAACSLLTTLLNRRTEGMRLTELPLFSWSTLATSTVLVLATPVFLAGLTLLFYDQHYGGTLFGAGAGGRRIWQHQLWVLGQPMALLFGAACVGAFCDIVSTAARRPLTGFGVARVATVAAPLLTLLLWAGNLSTLRSPFGPVATAGGVLVGAPLGLALLTWAATLRSGAVRVNPGLFFIAAYLAVVGLAAVLSVAAVFAGVEGGDAEAFRNGQTTLLVLGAPLLGLAGAAVHWSPKITGRSPGSGPAGILCLLLLGGVVLTAAPAYLVGFGADGSVLPLGIAGSALTAGGAAMLLARLAGSRRSDSSPSGPADPYGGLTLEWATSSPPPPHNFDVVPEVRSAHPLAPDESAE
ncbi:MAG: cbb3-type cytochrome c oxidase subunit I [Actinobacteria bacterium]|nr:cbb3-type cytochrome c oxidase subunit I [Actinomycetota bacterium]MBW3650680.1 cbb3-type cytochrome c oxidase subunit I [Actinomycetota bacterium]